MSGLISGLAGAGGAASNTGSYYQNAMGNLVNSTGSPAAQTFGNEEAAALQPQFNNQDQNMSAQLAAQGITNSGAGKADFSQLAADQSATLAGQEGGLYSQALGEYGQIDAAMPGAQANSYQNAINNFYQAVSDATGGIAPPPSGGGGGNPYASTSALDPQAMEGYTNPYATDTYAAGAAF